MILLFWLIPLFSEPGLQIEFTNLREAKGSIYVAVYDRYEGFLTPEKAIVKKIVPLTKKGTMRVSLDNLPPGRYAISSFHDVNGNGQLDTNWAGIPNEPYGFSNNARPKFRAPSWNETVFNLSSAGSSISIRMEKW